MGDVGALDIFTEASAVLTGSRKNTGRKLFQLCAPSLLPPLSSADMHNIETIIARVHDEDARNALKSILQAKKLQQQPAGPSTKVEQRSIEYSKALLTTVRELTRVASNRGLPATIMMTKNAEELAAVACSIGDVAVLNDSAGAIRQAFRITVSDYKDEEPLQGRTTRCYDIAVLLLRLYVNMKADPLAEGILEAINQYAGHIPDLQGSPWKTKVQFSYYKGLFYFLKQSYAEATQCFNDAIEFSEYLTTKQFERIMAYAIPASYMRTNRAPASATWEKLPELEALFKPVITACRQGNFQAYREHLVKHGDFLRRNRLYLVCDALLSRLKLNLLRRTWEILGRPKRLPIGAYTTALHASGLTSHRIPLHYAAEFYVSQFILSGEVKGYIHHDMRLVMLSKKQPFPTIVKTITDE